MIDYYLSRRGLNMSIIKVSHITKSFADKVAVDDISFSVDRGEIFGLIGPNGAGKSSTIRMIMNIIKPDIGNVSILGENLSEASKDKIGYLPEERGLYKKLSVMDSIIYLASLKDMSKHSAEMKANQLLEQTGMLPQKNKKIEELSKGMGQIIQFIVTIIHDPELVVLDEPFSGLDPANAELLKRMIIDLRNQGKAIMMSTHRMDEVEELCDRLLMIDEGKAVLYGTLKDIKSKYRNNSIILDYEGELGDLPGVAHKKIYNGYVELFLDGSTTPNQLLETLVSRKIAINKFQISTPTLNEIFLKIVGEKHE
jgi:ABC-2 type transport system ATP-binding protein